MLLIVASHFSVHGGFEFSTDTITVNRLWIQFIIGGNIGVDIFVLISGYFLIQSSAVKIHRVLRLWLQIFTYSMTCFCIFVGFGIEPFGLKTFAGSILPITFRQWWFASTYFMLYLLSPYLNKWLFALSKKEYQHFLVLLTVCWSIIPTFLIKSWQGSELLWFIYLYALAGYIRLHAPQTDIKCRTYILISMALTICLCLSIFIFDILGQRIPFVGSHATFFNSRERLPVLLISLTLFLGFLKLDIGSKPFLNKVASATFGVYLIHENIFMRSFLWKTVFKNASYSESNMLIPYSIFVIAIVFSACTGIELARTYIEKYYLKKINRISDSISRQIEKIFLCPLWDKL